MDKHDYQDSTLPDLYTLRSDALAAAVLLTRIPVVAPEEGDYEAARGYWAFGLIGVAVAVPAAVLAALLAGLGTPALAAAAVAMGAIALLTGGMHHDGLADVADGLGGRDPEHRLAIMRDPGTGSFGTLALVIVSIVSIASLAGLASVGIETMVGGLVAAACLSRSMMAVQRWRHDPPTDEGLAHDTGRPSTVVAAISVAAGLALAIVFAGSNAAIAALVGGLAATLLIGWFLERWIGGVNGDGLGATQQVSEAVMLLLICALAG